MTDKAKESYFVTVVTVNGIVDSAYECEEQADAFVNRRNEQALFAESKAKGEARIIPSRHWSAQTIRLYRRGDERP
jgi:hypothetical protein